MQILEKIVRLRTVRDRTGLSKTTIYRKIREGTFPRQVPVSAHGAGWYESDINRWIANPPGYRAGNGNSDHIGRDGHAKG